VRKPLGFAAAALWALSAAYGYGMVMLWVVGEEKLLAVLWPTLIAIVVFTLFRRAAGLLAPDSRVLAAAFFLVAALVSLFLKATNVYLVVAIVGLLWQGVRLWALAAYMKPLFAALGLEGADTATVVHATMIADTVGRMSKAPRPTVEQVVPEPETAKMPLSQELQPGLIRHALRNRILLWMGAPRIPYRPENWKSKRSRGK
jgi:hypothetical protein